jgi:hypothetical protein
LLIASLILSTAADIETVMAAIFAALGDMGERDGNNFVVSSGYGSGPMVIDVRHLAAELLERFIIYGR